MNYNERLEEWKRNKPIPRLWRGHAIQLSRLTYNKNHKRKLVFQGSLTQILVYIKKANINTKRCWIDDFAEPARLINGK